MSELVLPVENFPGYFVTSTGFVQTERRGSRRNLTQLLTIQGRRFVILYNGGRPGTNLRVHQLVAHHFIGPRPPGLITCHNDGNHLNNDVSNLRYDTHKANSADMMRHGTHVPLIGSRNPGLKLTDADVLQLRDLRRQGWTYPALAKLFDIEVAYASKVGNGKKRTHV